MARGNDRDLVVEDRVEICRPRPLVYERCWDPRLWVKVASHVRSVEILEESPTFQKFRMTIASADGEHDMVSERVADPPARITYRQLRPPALLDRHSGSWEFEEDEGRTRIRLRHRVRINEGRCRARWPDLELEDILARVADLLGQNGRATLQGLKAEIEAQ